MKRWLTPIVLVFLLLPTQMRAQQPQQWRPVGGGILMGISGMALVEHSANRTLFLVVHDNKREGEGRAGLLTIEGNLAPVYQPVDWPGRDLPEDLEALSNVPGRANRFLALASAGSLYDIELDSSRKAVRVIRGFHLPDAPRGSNFEGFALRRLGDQLLAVWAHRGETADPAVVYWSTLDLNRYSFTDVHFRRLRVPWPASDVRHVSDLKMDEGGAVYITSASDPGNDGPFASALYLAGSFQMCAGQFEFFENRELVRLQRFYYHKIEAFELVPGAGGGIAFGTDDENMGSSIYLDW